MCRIKATVGPSYGEEKTGINRILYKQGKEKQVAFIIYIVENLFLSNEYE